MALTDAHLIARVIADDDRHAFGELVKRHQSDIRSLLRRLTCGDTARADDLAQDTFLRAYRGLRRFRGGAKFSSWLYRIAYNTFLTDQSRQVRRAEEPETEASAPRGGGDSSAGSQAALRHDLTEAMDVLSPQERAAVTLAYNLDASHEDIAQVLEIPLGTAKSHLTRARAKLQRRLRAWAPAEAI